MYKDNRYINAGTNEFYRYGNKAVEKVSSYLKPNDKGYYSIPVDGGKYWTFGTSNGKYGEFAKIGDTCFSVNNGGFLYAKAGTPKGDAFVKGLNALISDMKKTNQARAKDEELEDESLQINDLVDKVLEGKSVRELIIN